MLAQGNEVSLQQKDDEDVIDLSHYFNIVNRNKWRILLLAFVVTLLAALIALSLTPHKSTASLLVEETNIVSIEQVYGLDSSKQEYFETQYEILKSRHIAEKVVDRLELGSNPLTDKLKSDDDSLAHKLKNYIKSVLTFLPQNPEVELTQEQLEGNTKKRLYYYLLII